MEPDPTIRQTGEDALVARLLPLMPSNAFLVTGPGDDCAVARSSGNRQLLLKTDCVVEGMHFLPGTDPELIGRKALARAVSDIAAMGGTPLHALVTLFVHADRPVSQVEGIYRGMGRLARQFGISIAGGESSGLPEDGLIISVALTGEVAEGKAVLRSTARAGDLLAVTGVLGGSFPTGAPSFLHSTGQGGRRTGRLRLGHRHDGPFRRSGNRPSTAGRGLRTGIPHSCRTPSRAPGLHRGAGRRRRGGLRAAGHVPSRRPGAVARLAAEHFPETPFTVIGEMTTEPSSALPSGYRHFN